MKALVLFIEILFVLANVNLVQAANIRYSIKLTFPDDTTFRGNFDYDATTQQVSNLKGELDDVLMGNVEPLNYYLGSERDGQGGITAYVYALNTRSIATNPPVNNNVSVAINFNAIDPTLGPTTPSQLSYMDCSVGGLMGKTCMYYLSWHKPVVPMEGGHGVLSEKITRIGEVPGQGQASPFDCMFNRAELAYPQFLSPAGSASQNSPPYYFRYYQITNAYFGVSSADNHVYYLGPDGVLQDLGQSSDWLKMAGCQ